MKDAVFLIYIPISSNLLNFIQKKTSYLVFTKKEVFSTKKLRI